MTDPKRTTDLSEMFVCDDARTIRVPRLDDIDAPTTRVPPRKVTLICRGRRATFALDSLTATSATLTGPLTFVVGDRVDLTFDAAGEAVTLAAVISRVTIADLLTDEVEVRFLDLGSATLDRIAAITA